MPIDFDAEIKEIASKLKQVEGGLWIDNSAQY